MHDVDVEPTRRPQGRERRPYGAPITRRNGAPASSTFWKVARSASIPTRPSSPRPVSPPSSSASCCTSTVGACYPRTTCAASATGCVDFATAGAQERSSAVRSMPGSARGSRTHPMQIRGACAMRSSRAAGISHAPWSLNGPLSPCRPRRFLEQQSTEPPLGQPQQEHHRQPEQQPLLPVGQNVFRQSCRDHGPGRRALNVQGRS